MKMDERKEWVIRTSKDLFIWYILITEGVLEITDVEKQYSLLNEKLGELIEKMRSLKVDVIYDMTIDILRAQNEFNNSNGFETMDEALFKNEIQMAYPGKGLLGVIGGVWVTNKAEFGKDVAIELYKGLSKEDYIEMVTIAEKELN